MFHQFSRTEFILGHEAMEMLQNARVLVCGVGGVGSFAAEALARAGVGTIELVDSDCVNLTNLNRQIIALHTTLGRKKVDVMKERILDINPSAHVVAHDLFFNGNTAEGLDLNGFSYVVDAIDTVSSKIELIERCRASRTPVISSMGTGNKLDPTRLLVGDIYETSVCPLARVMRHELRKRGIEKLKVVYSTEKTAETRCSAGGRFKKTGSGQRFICASVAGLIIAGEVIRDLAGPDERLCE